MPSIAEYVAAGLVAGAVVTTASAQTNPPRPAWALARSQGPAPTRVPPPAEPSRCATELARLATEPELPGDPDVEGRRVETFARAKAHPILWKRAPAIGAIRPEAEHVRESIHGAEDPVKALYSAYPSLQKRRDLAREVLLTDGYLYAARPWFAAALSNLVRVEDLFGEPELWLARGAAVHRLERRKEKAGPFYVHADGPNQGSRVKILLFDRVAVTKEELSVPLHLDVGAVAKELGFQALRIRRMTSGALAADLRYGVDWVPSVFQVDGARLTLACEDVPSGRKAAVDEARATAHRREQALERLRAVMREQVDEGLPFDEPKTEFGQEDGKLRQHWGWAYRFGRTQFDFNEDRYRVFDVEGRPRVPQVCIDFIRDTFERASGSWYRKKGEPRERVQGALDFRALGIENERSVEQFVDFARSRPEWFDVYDLTEEERVPYFRREQFFSHLAVHRDRYRPGDVVTIYGLRDDGKLHYHSFFVYEADPVTGAPSLVAANSGRPRIRPWEGEMVTAPLRSIRTRIRPKLEWLESITRGV